ncbi:MAG: hypothetical protein HKM93_00985 [Desulfobacteraceae bacterium]|nr:hypothetical protein [Desulfobacteraceae bacterium]
MTPYELAKMIHRDISPIAPRLSSAINRALIEIGEGSALVGLGPGTHENDAVSFQEFEEIALKDSDGADILSKINEVISSLEKKSSWRVIVDKKPGRSGKALELLYTLIRSKAF